MNSAENISYEGVLKIIGQWPAAQQIALRSVELHRCAEELGAGDAFARCTRIRLTRARELPAQRHRRQMACRKLRSVVAVKRTVCAQHAAEVARAHTQAARDHVNSANGISRRHIEYRLRCGVVLVQTEFVIHRR